MRGSLRKLNKQKTYLFRIIFPVPDCLFPRTSIMYVPLRTYLPRLSRPFQTSPLLPMEEGPKLRTVFPWAL